MDADDDEDRAPGEREVEERSEGPVAGAPVGAAGTEEILAVDEDPDRPEREEREGERRGREREHASRPPVAAEAAEAARRAVEEPTTEPVDGERVEGTAEKGPDRNQRRRERRVVQEVAGDRRPEHRGDPREAGDRQQLLL